MTQAPTWDSQDSDVAVALAAARAGVREVNDASRQADEISFKGDADPVTEADLRSQQAITGVLCSALPDDVIVAEERTTQHLPRQGRVWLVDPLDGTTNFIHGFPWMAVSVALWIDNRPAVGVVIDITSADEYTAIAGMGTWRNGETLRVRTTHHLADALVVTGFPYNRTERTEICDTTFRRVLAAVQGVRRLGAASLDMCMVASGKLDGYWEEDLSPWDMGAGVLMVTEAGGRVTDQSGQPVGPYTPFVVASNGRIHHQFLETLRGPGSS